MAFVRPLAVPLAVTSTLAAPRPPPHDHAENAEWRRSERVRFEAFLDAQPPFLAAVSRLMHLARAIPQLPVVAAADPLRPLGVQPRWRSTAEARFIPATVADIMEHLSAARRLEPEPSPFVGGLGLPADLRSAVRFVSCMRDGIGRWREEQSEELVQVSGMLVPVTECLYAQFAPRHIAEWRDRPLIHVALFAALVRALSLPDLSIAADLVLGMPAWGELSPSGWWASLAPGSSPVAPVQFTPDECAAWNEWLHGDIGRRPASAADEACWHATMAERGTDRLCELGVIAPDSQPWCPATMDGPFTFEDMQGKFGPALRGTLARLTQLRLCMPFIP